MPSNLGAVALSNTAVGLDPKKTSTALAKVESKRQLPQRDYQGKFVERNTGLMLNALGNIYSQLRQLVDLTKESLNIEKKEQLDDKAAKTGAKIDAGETDLPPEITDPKKKKGPGILGKIKGAAGSLWAGMGTKTAFAAVVGGLALLTNYSDQLVDPLTKVLEWMRDNMVPKMKKLWIDIKGWWTAGWEAVTGFFGMMGDTFTAIKKWKDKFDINKNKEGTLGLETEEWEALRQEIMDTAVDQVSKFFKELFFGVGSFLIQGVFLTSGIGMAWARLKPILFGTAIPSTVIKGGVPGAMTKPGIGALGVASIGLMLVNAYIQTQRGIQFAMEEAVQDGTFDYSQFAAAFFGGKAEGGWRNAFATSTRLGGTFSGAGIAIGLAFGGPVGAMFGGIIGYIAGSLIGLVTGKMGADKLDVMFDHFGSMISHTADVIMNWFEDIGVGAQALLKGQNPLEAIRKHRLADVERIEKDIAWKEHQKKSAVKRVTDLESRKKEDIEAGRGRQWEKGGQYYFLLEQAKRNVEFLNLEIAKKQELLKVAPALATQERLEKLEYDIAGYEDNDVFKRAKIDLADMEAQIAAGTFVGKTDIHDEFTEPKALKRLIAEHEAKYAGLVIERDQILASMTPALSTLELQTQTRDIQSLLADPNWQQGKPGNLSIGNKVNADNVTTSKTDNVYSVGFTYSHPNATAQALARTRGFALGYHGL